MMRNPQLAPLLFTDVRQRLGKRRYSPDRGRSPSPSPTREAPAVREPSRGVHRRLGVASQDGRGFFSSSSKDRKKSKSVWLMMSHRRFITVLWVSPANVVLRAAGALWSRLGSSNDEGGTREERKSSSHLPGRYPSSSSSSTSAQRRRGDREEAGEAAEEEDDSTLQKIWGAMIKQKQERQNHKMKKSRLDNLPSLQIEISRDSSDDSDA